MSSVKNFHNPSFQSCSCSQNAMTSVPSFPNLAALFAATPCVPKTYMGELNSNQGNKFWTASLQTLWLLLPAIVIFLCLAENLLHTSSYLGIPKVSTNSKPRCHTVRNTISPYPRHLRKKYSHTKLSNISTWPVAPAGLGSIVRLTQNESRDLYCQDILIA